MVTWYMPLRRPERSRTRSPVLLAIRRALPTETVREPLCTLIDPERTASLNRAVTWRMEVDAVEFGVGDIDLISACAEAALAGTSSAAALRRTRVMRCMAGSFGRCGQAWTWSRTVLEVADRARRVTIRAPMATPRASAATARARAVSVRESSSPLAAAGDADGVAPALGAGPAAVPFAAVSVTVGAGCSASGGPSQRTIS